MNGNLIIRIGIGLVFLWGGLEKFFKGFLGGVGMDGASNFVGGLFGVEGTFATIVTVGLAITELALGLLMIVGKRLFETYAVAAIVMLVALIMVWIPGGIKDMSGSTLESNLTWIHTIMHISLVLVLIGLALNSKSTNRIA